MTKNYAKKMYFLEKFKDLCGLLLGFVSIFLSMFWHKNDSFIWLSVLGIIFIFLIAVCLIDANSNYRYIKRQMAYIRQAEHSVIVVMRSVSPEETHRYYRKFDEELEWIIKQKDVKVRVLAPYRLTEGRLKGATQIYHRSIPMLFSKQLVDMNLSYILVDGKYLVCSQQRVDTIQPSRKCAELVSVDIGKALTNQFNNLWSNSLSYDEYCKDCNRMINSYHVNRLKHEFVRLTKIDKT